MILDLRVYLYLHILIEIKLPFSQVVIIDELSLNDDDAKKLKSGKTSELEETLVWLADNTAMTLAALSSTSLLDRRNGGNDDDDDDDDVAGEAVSQTELDEMITRIGFKGVNLKHIMRSSQKIAAATSTAKVSEVRSDGYNIPETILPGSSSTVPGTLPKAWVYKDINYVNYQKLAGYVTQYLRTLDTEKLKCVVLTDPDISSRQLSIELRRNTPVSCYDGNVETFDEYLGTPIYREESTATGDGGEGELTAWLRAEAGVLVTSEVQFRGAEADSVIFVTRSWGDYGSNLRSPVTRAVAGLLLITSDYLLNIPVLRRSWEVKILEILEPSLQHI